MKCVSVHVKQMHLYGCTFLGKQCKKRDFCLGRGGGFFYNVFHDRPTKWLIAKEKRKNDKNICALGRTTTNLIN